MAKVKDPHGALFDKVDAATKLEPPCGWIQWKGTEVCCDIRCPCGRHSHIDAEFAYYFRCGCGQLYAMGAYVKLVPIRDDELPSEGLFVIEDGRAKE